MPLEMIEPTTDFVFGVPQWIVIAFMAGVPSLVNVSKQVEHWSTVNNPFFNGPNSDLLALIPFVVLCVLLYLVGRDVLLANRPGRSKA